MFSLIKILFMQVNSNSANTIILVTAAKHVYAPYLSAIEMWKRLTNHTREYWYIGSMFGRSVVEKKRTDPCSATGR